MPTKKDADEDYVMSDEGSLDHSDEDDALSLSPASNPSTSTKKRVQKKKKVDGEKSCRISFLSFGCTSRFCDRFWSERLRCILTHLLHDGRCDV